MIQMFAMMYYVPYDSSNVLGQAGQYAPYFEPKDFPLHMCSIQFIVLFIAAKAKDMEKKKKALAFFFPTAIFGASMALILSNVFTIKGPHDYWMTQCFISPVYYSFFFVHAYLLFAGLYIARNKDIQFHFKDCFNGIFIMFCLGFGSLLVNSLCTVVTRDAEGNIKTIISNANLFFTTDIPIDAIKLTEKWQYILYFIVLMILVVLVFILFFLPFYFKDKIEAKKKINNNDLDIENTCVLVNQSIEEPKDSN